MRVEIRNRKPAFPAEILELQNQSISTKKQAEAESGQAQAKARIASQ